MNSRIFLNEFGLKMEQKQKRKDFIITMSKLTELFEKLESSLISAKANAEEFEKGKKIAAGKLRKEAQVSKKVWQDIRVETMDILKSMPTKTREKKA